MTVTLLPSKSALANPPRRTRRSGRVGRAGVPALVLVLLAFFVGLPLLLVVVASFTTEAPRLGGGFGSLTLQNYESLVSSQGLRAFRNSAVIGVGAGSLAMAIGTGLAWLAARTDVPGRKLAELAGIMPLFISGFVGAMAWSLLASPQSGYINLALSAVGIDWNFNIYSMPGIIFVQALYYSPYAYLFVFSSLSLMNPELEEAALVHGASQRGVLRRITMPLARPALLAAGILTFTLVVEDFPIPVILGSGAGITTLPSYVYQLMTVAPSRVNQASAVGVALMVIMVVLVTLQRRFLRGRTFTTVSGKGFRPRRIALGRWRWLGFLGVVLYLFVAVVLPMLALLQTAVSKSMYISDLGSLFDPSNVSLEGVRETLTDVDFIAAAQNSLIVGVGAGIVATIIHFLLAYYLNRTSLPGRRAAESLAMVPAAVPALVFGVGMLWTWTILPGPVYGTLLVLAIAYIVRFTPQGLGGMSSGMHQIDPDLEAAAVMSGAGRARTLSWVTVPLLRTSVVSTALLMFILSMRELSASIFLYTSNTRVLSVAVFEEWQNGQWSGVATMSLSLSLLLLVLTLLGRRWLRVT